MAISDGDNTDGTDTRTGGIINASTGISVGNPTSSPGINGGVTVSGSISVGGSVGPGGSRPTDTPAYIVCQKIGKL